MPTIPLIPVIQDVPRPRAWGYNARINDILLRFAVDTSQPLEVVTAEATPPKIDTAEFGEDIRDEVGFRYSRVNLTGGAGLDFLHTPDRPPDASTRFWDSRGVDVFQSEKGKVYSATLMHDVASDTAISGTSLLIAQIDGQIYYVDDDEVWEYGQTPAQDTLAADASAFFAMGNSLYTLDATSGVSRYDPPSWTPTVIDATAYDNIWGAKARVFGAVDNELYETDPTTPTLVLTLPDADRITKVVDAGPSILVFNTSGTIFILGLDDSLSVVNIGQASFTDEIPISGAYSQGVVGIVTASTTEAGGVVTRFYTAELGASGDSLVELALQFQIGDRATSDDLTPTLCFSTRDSIYFVTPEEGESVHTTWRFYLPTAGYARAHELDSTIGPSSAVEIDDRMWFALPGDGLWKEQDTYVADGYVIGPAADFYTADRKQWVSAQLAVVANPAGAIVRLYDSTNPLALDDPDHSSWMLAGKVQVTGVREADINDLTGRDARYHLAMVRMYAPSGRAETPGLRSYAFRAFPSSDRDILIRMPINVSDQFESPGKRALVNRGRGAVLEAAIRELEGTQVVVEVFSLNLLVRGMLEKIETPITVWPERGNPLRVLWLLVRGEEIAGSPTGYGGLTSGASLGQDLLGVTLLGVGEVN